MWPAQALLCMAVRILYAASDAFTKGLQCFQPRHYNVQRSWKAVRVAAYTSTVSHDERTLSVACVQATLWCCG